MAGLLRFLRRNRRLAAWSALAGAVTAAAVVAGLPDEYRSEATMAPEGLTYKSGGGVIEFALLSGFESAVRDRVDGINFPLFPEVAGSAPFLSELRDMEPLPGVRLEEYLLDRPSGLRWTVPFARLFRFSGRETDAPGDTALRRNDYLEAARERIGVGIRKESGLIVVSVRMPDAAAAARVARKVMDGLVRYMIRYRTEKARRELDIATGLLAEARGRYEAAALALALHLDRNRCSAGEVARSRAEQLRREKETASDAYMRLALAENEARIRCQQQTPCLTVIEPAQVPCRPCAPDRPLICLLSALGVAALSVALCGKRK